MANRQEVIRSAQLIVDIVQVANKMAADAKDANQKALEKTGKAGRENEDVMFDENLVDEIMKAANVIDTLVSPQEGSESEFEQIVADVIDKINRTSAGGDNLVSYNQVQDHVLKELNETELKPQQKDLVGKLLEMRNKKTDPDSYPTIFESVVRKLPSAAKGAPNSRMPFQWRDRRLVLRKTTISWYKGTELKGRILFEASDQGATAEKVKEPPHTFMVNGYYVTAQGERLDNVCLKVQCKSSKERDNWIISIADVLLKVRASKKTLEKEVSIKEKYDMQKKLGQGQFGEVFAAVSKQTGQAFAIKCINRRAMLSRGVNLSLIERELNVMMELQHPHIVKVDGYDIIKNNMYIAMEYCEGGELKERIKLLGHYPQEEAKIVARKLFEAVAFCHKRGILHRDLKPENILLKSKVDNTNIKLIDFGFAKVKEVTANAQTMQTQLGTPKYISPEILDKNLSGYYDGACPEKVDIWSAGVVCYNMLSGQHPFSLKNEVALCQGIRRGKFSYKDPVWNDVHADAKSFIKDVLNIVPVDRPSAEKALSLKWLKE